MKAVNKSFGLVFVLVAAAVGMLPFLLEAVPYQFLLFEAAAGLFAAFAVVVFYGIHISPYLGIDLLDDEYAPVFKIYITPESIYPAAITIILVFLVFGVLPVLGVSW